MINFMENLKSRKYPFIKKHDKQDKDKIYYVLKFRSFRAFFCLGVSITCFLGFLLCCICYDYKSKINTLFIVPFIIFLALSIRSGTFHELQILQTESDQNKYEWKYKKYFFVFLQADIINREITQLYIRILKTKGFEKQDRYYLVIGGNGISPIPISSATYNLDLIRSIGQKMSTISSIKLNFFDVEDFPRYHNIILSPPAKKW